MGPEPDRFIPMFKSEREIKLESSLQVLCQLKEHKDRHGKTELYLYAQPFAWEEARNVVKTD